jgi:hypothetical protein
MGQRQDLAGAETEVDRLALVPQGVSRESLMAGASLPVQGRAQMEVLPKW